VLAAGASTRMDRPKQLLEFRGCSLLRRAAEAALAAAGGAGAGPVVVVLGSRSDQMAAALAGLGVLAVVNPRWELGMGTSVRAGIAAIGAHSDVDAVLITLADQPMVDAATLRRLIDQYRAGGRPIAAAFYNGAPGVPAVFGRSLLAELAALPDAGGAKSLLQRHADQVLSVEMPAAAMDVDRPEDFQTLQGFGTFE
jgi:molybdenum cofactor cytidylyltransferase